MVRVGGGAATPRRPDYYFRFAFRCWTASATASGIRCCPRSHLDTVIESTWRRAASSTCESPSATRLRFSSSDVMRGV